MRSCEEYEELISEFLDGELTREDQLALMKHMSGCPDCQKYFDDLVAIHEAMEDMDPPAVPEGFAERVMARVGETKQDPAPKKPALFPRWQRWAAMAACCAVAAGCLWAVFGRWDRGDSSRAVTTGSPPYQSAPAESGGSGEDAETLYDIETDGAADHAVLPASVGEDEMERDQSAPEAAVASEKDAPESIDGAALENGPPAAAPSAGYFVREQEDSTLLDGEAARNVAVAHAGLAAADVTFTKTQLDWEDGKQVYEVEFFSPPGPYDSAERTEYEYDIDAVTGTVVKYGSEIMNPGLSPAPSLITEEDAKARALARAGLTAENVTFTKTQLDWEDGKQVYEVEFYAAGAEYDCEIDAATGDVVKFDYDAASPAPPVSAETVSREKAQEIALARVPGAAADNITKLKLDDGDGAAVYEVEIVYGGMEYDLEIDARSGAVLEFEAEKPD